MSGSYFLSHTCPSGSTFLPQVTVPPSPFTSSGPISIGALHLSRIFLDLVLNRGVPTTRFTKKKNVVKQKKLDSKNLRVRSSIFVQVTSIHKFLKSVYEFGPNCGTNKLIDSVINSVVTALLRASSPPPPHQRFAHAIQGSTMTICWIIDLIVTRVCIKKLRFIRRLSSA